MFDATGCIMATTQLPTGQRKWAQWFRAEAKAKVSMQESLQAPDILNPKQGSGLGFWVRCQCLEIPPPPMYEDQTLFGPQVKVLSPQGGGSCQPV